MWTSKTFVTWGLFAYFIDTVHDKKVLGNYESILKIYAKLMITQNSAHQFQNVLKLITMLCITIHLFPYCPCPVLFPVTCCTSLSNIFNEKNSSSTFICTAAIYVSGGKYSGSFELVTVELSTQSSLQSIFSCIDRIFIISRFCHHFMLLVA